MDAMLFFIFFYDRRRRLRVTFVVAKAFVVVCLLSLCSCGTHNCVSELALVTPVTQSIK
jgi:hypothetical protein